ncbi:MAG: SDR family oxidoreductase [Clostridiales bacterium]|nr:SDR family oxidoreductase [Clostridiales bacterium]
MKALITGASSGIGRDMARVLSDRGADLILVARRIDRLNELKAELPTKVRTIKLDLSEQDAVFELYQSVKDEKIDIVINNAGFGIFGTFDETDINREMELIDTNIRAVHILTKLFLKDFIERDSGYILNVSSSASFLPGPLLSSYYASKSYVTRLTEAVFEEMRRARSNVYIGVLCPGPVRTEFDEVADVKFSVKGLSSEYVAKYAVDKMFKRKLIIIPGIQMKLAKFFGRFLTEKALLRISYHMQKRKRS